MLSEEPVLFETEGGLIVLRSGKVVFSLKNAGRPKGEDLSAVAEKAKSAGITYLGTMDEVSAEELGKLGLSASRVSDAEREELNSGKLSLMVKAGFAEDEAGALDLVRRAALSAASQAITETSSREDLQLVHGIQALDELDKFVNITSERVVEWYGLHFPELQGLLGDNLMLCRIASEVGMRESFEEEKLQGMGFSQNKIEALVLSAKESKGGAVGERDAKSLIGLAKVSLSGSAEREKLAEYVESTMKRIAPNTTQVAGATIGARLIAKAGGLDRLARLPASTIQVLGAEKALFRALRTGARPPKHGILFQHEAVHTAPKWQRGKIARALANKIAIAARIDYYRGTSEGGLTSTLEKRLDEIRVRYKEAPKDLGQRTEGRPTRPGRPPFRGQRGETRGAFKKSKRWRKTGPSESTSRRR